MINTNERKLEIRVMTVGTGFKFKREQRYGIVNKATGNLVDLNKQQMALYPLTKEGIAKAREDIKILEASA